MDRNFIVEQATKAAIAFGVPELLKRVFSGSGFNKEEFDTLNEEITQYLSKCYEKNIYMNTIVFRGQPKKIHDLYIPLTIIEKSGGKKFRICEDDLDYNGLLEIHKKILIVDTAGMGKSTLVKFLTIQMIENKTLIPVVIELRKITRDTDFLQLLREQICTIYSEVNCNDIISLIKAREFLFLFDGFDEIEEDDRGIILDKIQDFFLYASGNHFVLTSREEKVLGCFSDFQTFSIKPLNRKEAFELIRKYDSLGEHGEELIKAISEDESLQSLTEFLKNPMMVSLLYKAYEYKKDIPSKKYLFYEQVYRALFDEHDLNKGGSYKHPKKTKLDIDDFNRVMRYLGMWSVRNAKVEFTYQELRSTIEAMNKRLLDLTITPQNFINDLTHAVPLFVEDEGMYRWVHKSFAEYFAALYICQDAKKNQEKILLTMLEERVESKYLNTLDFCYDLDNSIARCNIIYPVISEFVEYCNKSYKDNYYKKFSKNAIDNRRRLTYIAQIEIIIDSKDLSDDFEFLGSQSKIIRKSSFGEKWQRMVFFPVKCGLYTCIIHGASKHLQALKIIHSKKGEFLQRNAKHQNLITEDEAVAFLGEGNYIVNDDPQNPVNSTELFETINLMLEESMDDMFKNRMLSYNKCVALSDIIMEELKHKDEDIFFDNLS